MTTKTAPATDTFSAAYVATWAAFHAEPSHSARCELEAAAHRIDKAAQRAGLELDTFELQEQGRQQALAAEAVRTGLTVRQLEALAIGRKATVYGMELAQSLAAQGYTVVQDGTYWLVAR